MSNHVYIIAEVAQAHEGSELLAHNYIDACAKAGVDAVKFQTHIADAESSEHEEFRVKFSYEDERRIDYWRRMEFHEEQWIRLKNHCEEAGVDFMSSASSQSAIDLLQKIGTKKWKIGSGEIGNALMLDKIASLKQPIIMSSGMSPYWELDKAMEIMRKYHNDISLMQCTTSYPTPPERVGLNVMAELRERYNCPVGLSDHSARTETFIAAVALGAELLEMHVIFDKNITTPDLPASFTIDELSKLVDGVRFIETVMKNPVNKDDIERYDELRTMFGKTLAVKHNLKSGHTITKDDLETKKPLGHGIPAAEFETILGKKIAKDIGQYEFLTKDHIA